MQCELQCRFGLPDDVALQVITLLLFVLSLKPHGLLLLLRLLTQTVHQPLLPQSLLLWVNQHTGLCFSLEPSSVFFSYLKCSNLRWHLLCFQKLFSVKQRKMCNWFLYQIFEEHYVCTHSVSQHRSNTMKQQLQWSPRFPFSCSQSDIFRFARMGTKELLSVVGMESFSEIVKMLSK